VNALSERVVIGLGANQGDTRAHLLAGLEGLGNLDALLGLRLCAVSRLYRTAPWRTEGPDFVNAVAVLQGRCDEQAPLILLHELQRIENGQGRQRPFRYAPRTLDLDIILFGGRVLNLVELQVPHPRALQRAFVLRPLLDTAPDLVWPGLGTQWSTLLKALPDPPPEPLDDPLWPSCALKPVMR
jgi:2-amino-4-hydroxy-6-hydroxymethyldihydropteridine diphosphokinase